MERVFILGKMAEDMKENISMTKSMVMEFILGLMVVSMMVLGHMVNNMEKGAMFFQIKLLDKDYGKMVKELNGLMRMMFLIQLIKVI